MKAIMKQTSGAGNVVLTDIPEPSVKENEVKIKVMAAGICGTDIKIKNGHQWCNPPVILGHELSGQVIEIGSGVTSVQVGERVVCETAQVVCNNCYYCKSGNYLMCQNRLSIGYGVNGGMAEYCVVREGIIHKLPDNVDYCNGALSEPCAVAVHAVYDGIRPTPADVVLVSGCGTIGLLAAQAAKGFGATVIITGLSVDKKRLEIAKELGIDYAVDIEQEDIRHFLNQLTHNAGIDLAYECSGSAQAIHMTMSMLKKMGKLVQIGLTNPKLEIEYSLLAAREISIHGSFGHKWTSWETALSLISTGKIQTLPLITHKYAIDDWETAFEIAENQQGIKVLICPSI